LSKGLDLSTKSTMYSTSFLSSESNSLTKEDLYYKKHSICGNEYNIQYTYSLINCKTKWFVFDTVHLTYSLGLSETHWVFNCLSLCLWYDGTYLKYEGQKSESGPVGIWENLTSQP